MQIFLAPPIYIYFPQAHVALTCLATEPRPHYAHLEPVSSVVLAAGDTHTGAEVECQHCY